MRQHRRLDHWQPHRLQPPAERGQRGRHQRDGPVARPGRRPQQPRHHPLFGGYQGRGSVRARADGMRPRPSPCSCSRPAAPPAARPRPPRTPARWPAHTRRFGPACKQTGAIEVDRVQTLFNAALALAYQPLPAGNRIAILTNAGGPAAVAADVFEAAGLRLAQTSHETRGGLRGFLHPDAQVAGPVQHARRRGRDALSRCAGGRAGRSGCGRCVGDPDAAIAQPAAGDRRGDSLGRRDPDAAGQAGAGLFDGESQRRGGPRCGARGRAAALYLPRRCGRGVQHLVAPGAVGQANGRMGESATGRIGGPGDAAVAAREGATRSAERDPAGAGRGAAGAQRGGGAATARSLWPHHAG